MCTSDRGVHAELVFKFSPLSCLVEVSRASCEDGKGEATFVVCFFSLVFS